MEKRGEILWRRHIGLWMPVEYAGRNIKKAGFFCRSKNDHTLVSSMKVYEIESEDTNIALVPIDRECSESRIPFRTAERSPTHVTKCSLERVVNSVPRTDKISEPSYYFRIQTLSWVMRMMIIIFKEIRRFVTFFQ